MSSFHSFGTANSHTLTHVRHWDYGSLDDHSKSTLAFPCTTSENQRVAFRVGTFTFCWSLNCSKQSILSSISRQNRRGHFQKNGGSKHTWITSHSRQHTSAFMTPFTPSKKQSFKVRLVVVKTRQNSTDAVLLWLQNTDQWRSHLGSRVSIDPYEIYKINVLGLYLMLWLW